MAASAMSASSMASTSGATRGQVRRQAVEAVHQRARGLGVARRRSGLEERQRGPRRPLEEPLALRASAGAPRAPRTAGAPRPARAPARARVLRAVSTWSPRSRARLGHGVEHGASCRCRRGPRAPPRPPRPAARPSREPASSARAASRSKSPPSEAARLVSPIAGCACFQVHSHFIGRTALASSVPRRRGHVPARSRLRALRRQGYSAPHRGPGDSPRARGGPGRAAAAGPLARSGGCS